MNKIKLQYHQEIDNKIVKKELEFEENLIKISYSKTSLFVYKKEDCRIIAEVLIHFENEN